MLRMEGSRCRYALCGMLLRCYACLCHRCLDLSRRYHHGFHVLLELRLKTNMVWMVWMRRAKHTVTVSSRMLLMLLCGVLRIFAPFRLNFVYDLLYLVHSIPSGMADCEDGGGMAKSLRIELLGHPWNSANSRRKRRNRCVTKRKIRVDLFFFCWDELRTIGSIKIG